VDTFTTDGEALSEYVQMVSVTDVDTPPEPLIVSGYSPAGVEPDVDTVIVDVEAGFVTGLRENDELVPDGRPDTASDGDPVKPEQRDTVSA